MPSNAMPQVRLACLRVPRSTLWSNEQVLKLNPNDVLLRSEVLAWSERNELDRMPLQISDPELARRKVDHILWLLENAPHANLYFFVRSNEPLGIPSYQKIIANALKVQRKVYGKTVAKYRAEYPRSKKTIEPEQ